MAKCIFRDNKIVSDYGRPYIISEVNSSHNGDIELAKKMIDASVDIGCDCVKFQSWTVSSLYSKTYYDDNPIAKRFVKKFSLTSEQLKELSKYCNDKGISFASTPYSKEEVDFLIEECNVPFIKIASMEINNYDFLEYIGKKGIPVVLSTGMASEDEIVKAVSILEKTGPKQMVILHCVSIYPTELTTVNINNILGLREKFKKYPIGFSDHTEGDAASVAATTLGAAVIEKHLTLDKTKIGLDNGMATEPKEFSELVTKCRNIQVALGTKERIVSEQELEQRKKMRRSLVSTRDIHKGEIITVNDLCAKRPGTGISPDKKEYIIGKEAIEEIPKDTVIKLNQINEGE